MRCRYYCWDDSETGTLLVVFATPNEIINDEINGEHLAYTQEGNAVADIAHKLNDSGSMCEGYIIQPQNYSKVSDIPIIDNLIQGYGFIKDPAIEHCGWA